MKSKDPGKAGKGGGSREETLREMREKERERGKKKVQEKAKAVKANEPALNMIIPTEIPPHIPAFSDTRDTPIGAPNPASPVSLTYPRFFSSILRRIEAEAYRYRSPDITGIEA